MNSGALNEHFLNVWLEYTAKYFFTKMYILHKLDSSPSFPSAVPDCFGSRPCLVPQQPYKCIMNTANRETLVRSFGVGSYISNMKYNYAKKKKNFTHWCLAGEDKSPLMFLVFTHVFIRMRISSFSLLPPLV